MLHNLIGNLLLLTDNQSEAQINFERSFDFLTRVLQYYLNLQIKLFPEGISPLDEKKREKIVKMMIVVLSNWSISCENSQDYPKMKDCFNLMNYLSRWLLLFDSSDQVKEYSESLIKETLERHVEELRELSDIDKIVKMVSLKQKTMPKQHVENEDCINQNYYNNKLGPKLGPLFSPVPLTQLIKNYYSKSMH